ncbi:hypothetical protein KUTeg_002610 [Tegillarca granosa]|uniref:Fibronectin type-III domain-containing protein n=1 Tax=Tegillarca granosa TaxID=220873 RepID=A0ABQ9FUU5_TEGGR|nr:hypothetical protein KUTeg_002610 [Tegillarca granosa]
MYLKLTPLSLALYGLVTLEVDLAFVSFTKTLYKAKIWGYKTPTISKKLIDNRDKDEDVSPPEFKNFVDNSASNANEQTGSCTVRQIPEKDYTEPMFEISVRADDDRSGVELFLNVGTVPGGSDVLNEKELGGPSTEVKEKLSVTGLPLYFTVYAENSAGTRARVTCSLPTYDVTIPGGRFKIDYLSSSNPETLRASVVTYEDSKLRMSHVGVGFGKDIYGDQMIGWNAINLEERSHDLDIANWDGINDKESGILGYTITVGFKPCEDSVHGWHDPMKHFYHESQWTHSAMINPIDAPYTIMPDGKYYVTVRALNKVEYGGPLSTSVCHTTPYIIDNSPPIVYEIYNVQYEDHVVSLEHNSRAIGISDPIIVDETPPISGNVYDGPVFKKDLKYTKDKESICANWENFYDPDSGIDFYMVSVGTKPLTNVTDIANLTQYDRKTHEACVHLDEKHYLKHEETCYVTVWAFNRAHKQLNVSAISDGVMVDLTKPVPGEVIDGNGTTFTDLKFTAATAKLEAQWRGFSDPESTIYQYNVQVHKAKNGSEDYEIARDWTSFDNTTTSVKWLNFHFHHRDRIKTVLQTTNGALNSIQNETDGFIVDLTPPLLVHIGDGNAQGKDIDYQSSDTSLTANFKFYDDESGVDHYKIQIYQLYHGSRHQIFPDPNQDTFTKSGLSLKQGALYSIRIGATNKAAFVAAFETNGVQIDTSPPKIHWVRVGTFSEAVEEKVDGYVWQADTSGIKASFMGVDSQSGIVAYYVAVGGTDILNFKDMGDQQDMYIDNLNLPLTNISTKSPVYYVTVKAVNGAGLESSTVTSTPIVVVEEDAAECNNLDASCSESLTSVSLTWQPFVDEESGISEYHIAVGTTPGGGQIKPFFKIPITSKYYTVSGLNLNGQRKIYVSVKGVNGAGHSSVASSNGVYMSYLSQGLPPLSHVGVFDVVAGVDEDVDFQTLYDTIRAKWDVSGDPCPVVQYDWKIERLDGLVVQDWLNMGTITSGINDELKMKNGELYYSLLRVTNALGYTYIIRSNGVTIEIDPLLPGEVFDGDIEGWDLQFQPSRTKVSANWRGFGLPADANQQINVESGTLLHLATPNGPACPSRSISLTNSSGWNIMVDKGFRDPDGTKWKLEHLQEYINTDYETEEITIKLARDRKTNIMLSGAYWRMADLVNGGSYEIMAQAASLNHDGHAVTEILFWDGHDNNIATYNHVQESDWTKEICQCCFNDPVPSDCICNCTQYLIDKGYTGNVTTPAPQTTQEFTTPDVNTTSSSDPWSVINTDLLNNTLVDTTPPVAENSCGVQMYPGLSESHVVAWCRTYQDINRIIKTDDVVPYDLSSRLYKYKVVFDVKKEESTSATWCMYVFIDGKEITSLCGIPHLSINTKLVLHTWHKHNVLPEIKDYFLGWSTKARFKQLVMPPDVEADCRYGSPFRGGTNAIIKYEAGIGSTKLGTDIADYREVLKPCIPCTTVCTHYNCDPQCDPNVAKLMTFTLTNLSLTPKVLRENATGHSYYEQATYYLTGLEPGQTLLVNELTSSDLQVEYRSDASLEFVSYIVNPETTNDRTERLLNNRFKTYITSVAVVPVGNLPMPGPLSIVYSESADPTNTTEGNRTMLLHWNPNKQVWEISSRTCKNVTDPEVWNEADGTVTVKFVLATVAATVVNNPPQLTSPTELTMEEDGVILTITITDVNDAPVIFLSKNGQSILHPDPTETVVDDQFPCGSFGTSLPHQPSKMSWLYVSMTYTRQEGYAGYDNIRLYVNDSRGGISDAVHINLRMLLSPCQNEATCEALGSYPCDDEHRVTNFSSDYTCGCQPGWAEEDQLPEEDIIDLNSIEDRTDVDMTGESNDWDPDWKPERRHQMSTFSPLLGLTELKPTAPETKILPVLNPDYPSHSPAPWNRHKAGKVSTPWTKSTSSSPAPWNKPKSKKDSQLFKKPNSTSPAPWNKQKLKNGSLLPSVKMPQKDKHGVLSVEDLETKPNQVVGHLDPNWKQHETALTTDQHNEGYQSDDSIKCEIHENCSNVSSVGSSRSKSPYRIFEHEDGMEDTEDSHTVSIQILIPKCCECPDE